MDISVPGVLFEEVLELMSSLSAFGIDMNFRYTYLQALPATASVCRNRSDFLTATKFSLNLSSVICLGDDPIIRERSLHI